MPVMKLESSDAKKECCGSDLTRLAHPTRWDYRSEAIFQFLRSTIEYRRIYRAGTDDIDPNPSFELSSPSSGERTDGRFASTVDGSARKSFHSILLGMFSDT
jgi:hypothetical protein